jgi:hypothetical protein
MAHSAAWLMSLGALGRMHPGLAAAGDGPGDGFGERLGTGGQADGVARIIEARLAAMSGPRIAVVPSHRLVAIGAGDVDDEVAGKAVNPLPAGIRSVPPASWTSFRQSVTRRMTDSASVGTGTWTWTGQPPG